ncbi:hypothetical protein [Kribbella sp. NPDC055071]
MSTDFAFWKAALGDPGEIFDDLAEGVADSLSDSSDVVRFREELLHRLPDVVDVLEPDKFDLEKSPEKVQRYVLLTLSYRQLDYLDEILDLAKAHRLVGFSGVAGEPMSFEE